MDNETSIGLCGEKKDIVVSQKIETLVIPGPYLDFRSGTSSEKKMNSAYLKESRDFV